MAELLTKADVAKVLGITPDGVLYLEQKGLLPATRTRGGVRLFDEADVAELATERDLRRLEALQQVRGGKR